MEPLMRTVLLALAIAASPSVALAQSMTGTNGTIPQTTTAPASNTSKIVEPKSRIPPAANSKTRGLRTGNDALDAGAVEVKRNK
jgi:hypothetical protein